MDLAGKRIHFMGVGGIGMSALAEMAVQAGAVVTGCDRAASPLTTRLEGRGIAVALGHDPCHVQDVDLLVHTSAVGPDHPERQAAPHQERRGQFLAHFLSARPSCGVCGTHGKTTTSWLLAHLLLEAGLDPAVFIGGIVPQLPDGNYRLGSGPFVAELDESDGTFLYPELRIAVITNIDSDHLSHYQNDDALLAAFRQFAARVEQSGLLVAGIDNPRVKEIATRHQGKIATFGFHPDAAFRAVDVQANADGMSFVLLLNNQNAGEFSISLPGNHNVLNALAAIAAAREFGVSLDSIRAALPLAKGVERRLELLHLVQGVALYTDYAHHPAEMAASLAALRQRHEGKILLVFQPHLYSRTRDYADAFATEIAKADAAMILHIYPAREEPLPGVDANMLVEKAAALNPAVQGPFCPEEVEKYVMDVAGKYTAIVFMGAGDIDCVARRLSEYNSRIDSML